jgi:hypothetical protein
MTSIANCAANIGPDAGALNLKRGRRGRTADCQRGNCCTAQPFTSMVSISSTQASQATLHHQEDDTGSKCFTGDLHQGSSFLFKKLPQYQADQTTSFALRIITRRGSAVSVPPLSLTKQFLPSPFRQSFTSDQSDTKLISDAVQWPSRMRKRREA